MDPFKRASQAGQLKEIRLDMDIFPIAKWLLGCLTGLGGVVNSSLRVEKGPGNPHATIDHAVRAKSEKQALSPQIRA